MISGDLYLKIMCQANISKHCCIPPCPWYTVSCFWELWWLFLIYVVTRDTANSSILFEVSSFCGTFLLNSILSLQFTCHWYDTGSSLMAWILVQILLVHLPRIPVYRGLISSSVGCRQQPGVQTRTLPTPKGGGSRSGNRSDSSSNRGRHSNDGGQGRRYRPY